MAFEWYQYIGKGTTPHPEMLAPSDLPPPEGSEFSHFLPCSDSTVRAREKSSIMANRKSYTGFPTSHQPTFYAAPNFLKIGINYLNLSSFGQFRQYRTKSLLQSFIIFINCQQQSCSAINWLSSGINILAGGRPLLPEILAPSDLPPPEGSEF